ncbi:MAG: LamG-like jellyroll fold domain-containing protein [Phycisphaerales bacterium JB041]
MRYVQDQPATARPWPGPRGRRGGVYVLVLVVTTTVSAMALLGLRAAMSAHEEGRRVADSISARQNAASAMEIGIHTIETEPDWRLSRAGGEWISKVAIGTGSATVRVETVGGGAYGKDPWETIELSGYGFEGDSRSILRAQIALSGESTRDHVGELAHQDVVAYWPLNGLEGDGYETDEVGGNSLLKAWSGDEITPGLVPGLGKSTAPWFSGTGGAIEAKSLDTYLAVRSVSVWFWVSSTAGTQGIVTRDASGRGTGGRWELVVNSGALESVYDTSVRTVTLAGGLVVASRWNHAILTLDNDEMRLYLNGVRVDQQSVVELDKEIEGDAPTESILIGVSRRMGATTDPGSNHIRGSVCELALLEDKLSDSDAQDLYDKYPLPAEYKVVTDTWERVIE